MTGFEILLEAAKRHVSNVKRMIALVKFDLACLDREIAMREADSKKGTQWGLNEKSVLNQTLANAHTALSGANDDVTHWAKAVQKEKANA